MERRIAYLGLGVMGRGMVGNLLAEANRVTVWNRTPGRVGELTASGASEASSPAAAVRDAEVILYCLSDDHAVSEVVFGDEGILGAVQSGQIAVDMSTVHPETSRRQHEAYGRKGVRFLDAPVFGSKNEAAAGGLWIVVGGEEETFREVRPLFQPLAETVHYMGGAGKGTSMKLVGNLIVAAQLEALGEAMVLATKAGLAPVDVLEVLRVTDFRSPIFDGVGASLIERDFAPNFALKHMLKDANLISTFAGQLQAPAPASAAVRETIKAAMNMGWGDENASALIKALEAMAAVEVRAE